LGLPRDGNTLYLPDDAYPRFPLPPGNEAYAHVDGRKMKAVVEEIAAISRKSRDDGNQYWGRIPGTPYHRMTHERVVDQFKHSGRDHSAAWNGAMRRANEGGAALVFIIMGFPGNAISNPEGANGTRAPTLTISPDEGNTIREALERGKTVSVRVQADIKEKHGLKTASVWGTLPGTTDENIVVMPHTH